MREKFTRWNVLFIQYLKRDFKKLVIWILGVGLFASGFVPVFEEMFAKEGGITGMFTTLQNPAMISMVGPTPITEASDYTLGAMYANEMLVFTVLFAMIISIFHVIGHTRREEDLGLTELIRSFPTGRLSNSLAVMVETILINLVIVVFIVIVMLSSGANSIDLSGSLIYSLSVGLAGILGAVLGLIMAQVFSTSAGANGAALGIVGLLYVLRAGTDISHPDWSWFNPLSWTYLSFPFTENNLLPIFLLIALIIVGIWGALFLEGYRDLGAGFLPERVGRSRARKRLLSVHGLFLRLDKTTIIIWFVVFIVMGGAYGSIYGNMTDFLNSNEMIRQMFAATGVSIEISFTATIMMVIASLAGILPVAIANGLFQEERLGRMSYIFATKVSRSKLYFTVITLAIIAAAIGLFLGGVGLGATALSSMSGSEMSFKDFIIAAMNFFPALLFMIALAGLILGYLPSLGKVIYAYIGYSFAINYFNGMIDIPEWLEKTAILSWIPRMPMKEFEPSTFLILTVISLVMICVGYFGYCNRDLCERS